VHIFHLGIFSNWFLKYCLMLNIFSNICSIHTLLFLQYICTWDVGQQPMQSKTKNVDIDIIITFFCKRFFVLGLELILPNKFCNNINALISGKWYKSFYSLSPTFEFEYHYIIYIYCENNETCCAHLLQKLF